MVKVISELEKLGLKLTDEQKEAVKKSMGEELYSKAELDKKMQKTEAERNSYKERAETAEETLKGFEGKDFDTITKERDEWKKAELAEKDYSAKLAEREKNDLLKEACESIKFSSESAKKAIMADIAASVSVKDGKLIGFNDLLEDAKKKDASAFVNEEQQHEQNKAKFTAQQKNNTGETLTKDQIMAMKDPSERQRAIKENIGLFQKGE